jgi:hypothetical protein
MSVEFQRSDSSKPQSMSRKGFRLVNDRDIHQKLHVPRVRALLALQLFVIPNVAPLAHA